MGRAAPCLFQWSQDEENGEQSRQRVLVLRGGRAPWPVATTASFLAAALLGSALAVATVPIYGI